MLMKIDEQQRHTEQNKKKKKQKNIAIALLVFSNHSDNAVVFNVLTFEHSFPLA